MTVSNRRYIDWSNCLFDNDVQLAREPAAGKMGCLLASERRLFPLSVCSANLLLASHQQFSYFAATSQWAHRCHTKALPTILCKMKGYYLTILIFLILLTKTNAQEKKNYFETYQLDTFKISLRVPQNFGPIKYDIWYAYFEDVNQDSSIYGGLQIQPQFSLDKKIVTDHLIQIVGWFGFARGEQGINNISQLNILPHQKGYLAEYYLTTKHGQQLKGLTLGFKKKKTQIHPSSLWDYIFITYLGLEEHYRQNASNLDKVFSSVQNLNGSE